MEVTSTTKHLSRAAISGIVDAVRNLVLDWCLQLERDGILGEGLTFNAKEKETAAQSHYTINYNAPVSHSQIQQGSPQASQVMTTGVLDERAVTIFLEMLKKHTSDLNLDAPNREQLRAEVDRVENQISSGRSDDGLLRESLRSIRAILEGCAGGLIASGLMFEIGKLLQ